MDRMATLPRAQRIEDPQSHDVDAQRKTQFPGSLGLSQFDPSVRGLRPDILEAALDQFAAYGFSRTSMADIAKAAKMSRCVRHT